MALLSELVRTVAQVEGLEEVSVGIFARHARESGLIKQGGRGRSAAKMSLTDAANLLIAVNACSLAKDVPALVPKFRSMILEDRCIADASKLELSGISFGETLERFIEMMTDVEVRDLIPGQVFITFSRPFLTAEITCEPALEGLDGWVKLKYHLNHMHEFKGGIPDRTDEVTITSFTLKKVAELISTEEIQHE